VEVFKTFWKVTLEMGGPLMYVTATVLGFRVSMTYGAGSTGETVVVTIGPELSTRIPRAFWYT
jgi:hypothetical protein